jgi:nicotinamide riboside kinase
MKLSISGTYSAGKTSTVIALSHYTGIPRTLAKTIREIMPDAVPGKALAECTPAEYLQIAMRRHTGRAVAEAVLGDNFISDGSSLQEWIYGAARVHFGMNPSATSAIERVDPASLSPQMQFFAQVVAQYGHAFRQHVVHTFDSYVHLRNERPMANDGHRPMNEGFRAYCDEMLLATLDDLRIPYHVIGGSLEQRLESIVQLFDLPTVMSIERALQRTQEEYAAIDLRLETQRAAAKALAGRA